MGREVRLVPADWEHPRDESGEFIPLFDGSQFAERETRWDDGNVMWAKGLCDDFNGGWEPIPKECSSISYSEWAGDRPMKEHYMPQWPDCQKTHLMMYENTSEGTPISPGFATPEELARWLADTGASAFGPLKGTYEQWLAVAKGARAVGLVYDPAGGLRSGVAAVGEEGADD